jgi:hypothetical protein
MFEQESYDKATVQTSSQPGELFHNYEIKPWNYSATLYKILAASAVLNLAFLGFIAQTNLLTMRGCDSPWAGRVCQVLDMAYVGAMIYGTDREYVDQAYENIDLGEADITFIDVTGETPPLTYPEGYFQIANPVQYAMLKQMAEGNTADSSALPSGFSSLPNNETDLLKIRPNPPAANPGALQDDLGSTPPITNGGYRLGKRGGGRLRPEKTEPTPDDKLLAKGEPTPEPLPTASPTNPLPEGAINRKPFTDLASTLIQRASQNQLNLSIPFLVQASGRLNPDGKLEKKTFKYIRAESPDPQMIKDVQAGIEAFNDSGFLQNLSMLSGRTLDLTLQQDDTNISASVQSQVESETRATTLVTLMAQFVQAAINKKTTAIAEMEKANDPAKATELLNDRDDLELLKGLKVGQNGKNIVMTFAVPKEVALTMIKRKLEEQAAELQKPRGATPVSSGSNTAAK